MYFWISLCGLRRLIEDDNLRKCSNVPFRVRACGKPFCSTNHLNSAVECIFGIKKIVPQQKSFVPLQTRTQTAQCDKDRYFCK